MVHCLLKTHFQLGEFVTQINNTLSDVVSLEFLFGSNKKLQYGLHCCGFSFVNDFVYTLLQNRSFPQELHGLGLVLHYLQTICGREHCPVSNELQHIKLPYGRTMHFHSQISPCSLGEKESKQFIMLSQLYNLLISTFLYAINTRKKEKWF